MPRDLVAISARLPMPDEAIGAGLSPSKWRVLTDAIFPAAKSPGAVMLAVDYCKARGLDIMRRPVHIVPMWSKEQNRYLETVWQGINEIQVTAARTGAYAGMDPPQWGPERTETFQGEIKGRHLSATVTFPEWCMVTVYRMVGGQRCAFGEPVYWLETYSRIGGTEVPNEMWQRRTRGQLHKCAKAASLRAAFPEEGDYAAEEMEGKSLEDMRSQARHGVIVEGRYEAGEEELSGEEIGEPTLSAEEIEIAQGPLQYGLNGQMLDAKAWIMAASDHARTLSNGDLDAWWKRYAQTRREILADSPDAKNLMDALVVEVRERAAANKAKPVQHDPADLLRAG